MRWVKARLNRGSRICMASARGRWLGVSRRAKTGWKIQLRIGLDLGHEQNHVVLAQGSGTSHPDSHLLSFLQESFNN